MDWDQRAFAWLYRAFKRATGKADQPSRPESTLAPFAVRLETLTTLLAGESWEVLGTRGLGGVGGRRLLLPTQLPWIPTPEGSVSFYLYRTVFCLAASELGFVVPRGWSTRRRAVAMLLSVPTTEDSIRNRYPGAAPMIADFVSVCASHFPFEAHTSRGDCFRRLSIDLLAPAKGPIGPEIDDHSSVESAFHATARERHTPATLCAAAQDIDRRLDELPGRDRKESYRSPWGLFLCPDDPTSFGAPPEEPQRTLPSGTERPRPGGPTDIEEVDLDSQRDRDNPLVHSFEKVHTAAEYNGGRKQLDGSDELEQHEEALEELDLRKVTRSSEPAQSIYQADLVTHSVGSDAPEASSSETYHYPEWDFQSRSYREDWCTVNEVPSTVAPLAVVAEASRRLHKDVLRLQAELRRLEFQRRWRNRQRDGQDIDVDAVVDSRATLLAGKSPDPRVYVRRKVHDADLSLLVLVDASLSSDSWVTGRRVFDVARDAAQVLVEAFRPTATQLSLAAFYSNTRRDCRFVLAKRFNEPWHVGLQRLHGLRPAGYTRVGPALRHALHRLEQSGARKKLAVLITDAKPTDYDRYEGRYGVEDVRQATHEASLQGVRCVAMAVRDRGEAYLSQMFGSRGWALLPQLGALPDCFASTMSDWLNH